jgi:uncharacterized damage-inducible protein DinB
MDIVEWLRDPCLATRESHEAADEIVRLQKQNRINWDAFQKAATEIERLREALQHILTHYKSDTPPNAQALILFVNRALEEKE